MMHMPKPTPQHAMLERLVGTWRGNEVMSPMAWSPEGSTADGVLEARMHCGGLFLVMDYVQLKDGKPGFTGHGVYGWDEGEQCYTMHWFDSMTPGGFIKPVRGTWQGDVLTFTSSSPQHAQYVYTFGADGTLAFRIEGSTDGKSWQPFMEAKYRRSE